MMALTTVTDVKNKAYRRYLNFDKNRWTDTVIGNMITRCQKQIEMETGFVFDSQSFVQKFSSSLLEYPTDMIQLDYYPILTLTSVVIKGATKTNNVDYYANLTTGNIYFETYLPDEGYNDIVVTYTAGYNPTNPIAKDLCEDMVVYSMFRERETPPSLKKILSREEAEITEKPELLNVIYSIDSNFKSLPKKLFYGVI